MGKRFSVRNKFARMAFVAAFLMIPTNAGAASAPATRPAQQQAKISPIWGSLADLAGTTWRGRNGALKTYEWVIPNEVLREVIVYLKREDRTYTISMDPSGDVLNEVYQGTGKWASTVKSVRSGVITYDYSDYQHIRRITPTTIYNESVQKNGEREEWQETLVPKSDVPAALASIRQARDTWRRVSAEREAAIPSQWGMLAALAGQQYHYTSAQYPQYNAVTSYRWNKIGEEMILETLWVSSGKSAGVSKIVRDPNSGRIQFVGSDGKTGQVTALDSTKFSVSAGMTDYGEVITDHSLSNSGALRLVTYSVKNGKRNIATDDTHLLVTGVDLETLRNQQRNKLAANATAKTEKKSSGGGFLKVLQGAVGGLQGMADAGAGLTEGLVGAAIGAAAGAAGVDAPSISQSMYEGTAKVKADNDKLREIMETGTADALARGTAEYNRRQAAAGRPVEVAEVASSSNGHGLLVSGSASQERSISKTTSSANAPSTVTAYWKCDATTGPRGGKSTIHFSQIGAVEQPKFGHFPGLRTIRENWLEYLQQSGVAYEGHSIKPSCSVLSYSGLAEAQSKSSEHERNMATYHNVERVSYTPEP